jgi:hypothetical protein
MLVTTGKNKYYNRSRISEAKFREVIKHYSVDLNASQIAKLMNYHNFNQPHLKDRLKSMNRTLSHEESKKAWSWCKWQDYFFGLLKRGGKVYTEIAPNCNAATLQSIIKGKNESVRGNPHINGIESFWGYAKTRLLKFKGMKKICLNYS